MIVKPPHALRGFTFLLLVGVVYYQQKPSPGREVYSFEEELCLALSQSSFCNFAELKKYS